MSKYIKFFLFCFFLILLPSRAFSYFDPGAGSFLIQLFIAFIASCYLFITNPIQFIKNYFKKDKKVKKSENKTKN
tara:strand:+ start:120 stop:344 length:225 start_codon:yes stop_codon:yes gene_type:complete